MVDERSEIAAMYKGIPQNDIGVKTDILDSAPKAIGMKMLIRSMAPNVISADEIGSFADSEAINYAICSGIKGIFTAHGDSILDLKLNPAIGGLLDMFIFERIVILDSKNKGQLKNVYKLDKNLKKYVIY